ncbi:DinB family protein, partial [Streptomyces collinus]
MTAPETERTSVPEAEELRERALASLTTARARTTLLTSCVEDPDLTAQHSPLMSPLVWDLAHIGNQEEQWLLRAVGGREAMRPEIDGLYDAFEHPRAERPSLPLLLLVADVREVPDQRRHQRGVLCGEIGVLHTAG